MEINETNRLRLINYIKDTSNSLNQAAEYLGFEDDYTESLLLYNQEIEFCARCNYWLEWCELIEVDCEYICRDCCTDKELEDNDEN